MYKPNPNPDTQLHILDDRVKYVTMARITPKTQVIDGILDTLMLGGLVSAALVAPNMVQIVASTYIKHMSKRDQKREVQKIMQYMKRQAVITIKEVDELYEVTITEKGRQRAVRHNFDNLQIAPQKTWDEKWRIVIFDVPESYGYARRVLTTKLQSMGFKLLQKSVWVYPFPCRQEIELIKHVYSEVDPYIIFLETSAIDKHNVLVQKFKFAFST